MGEGDSLADQAAVAGLRSALRSLDPAARARALLRAPPVQGMEQLMIEALDDPEPDVRRASVQALARLDGPEGARALMGVAAGDPSPAIRAEALTGLSRILQSRSPELRRND